MDGVAAGQAQAIQQTVVGSVVFSSVQYWVGSYSAHPKQATNIVIRSFWTQVRQLQEKYLGWWVDHE